MSYTTIQAALRDIFGIKMSKGFLTKEVKQVSEVIKKAL
jgi:uncharacterized protein (UPF0335 family)